MEQRGLPVCTKQRFGQCLSAHGLEHTRTPRQGGTAQVAYVGLAVPGLSFAASRFHGLSAAEFDAFLAETCVLQESLSVDALLLYAAFAAWCRARNREPASRILLSHRLNKIGCRRVRRGTRTEQHWYWRGIRLKPAGWPG